MHQKDAISAKEMSEFGYMSNVALLKHSIITSGLETVYKVPFKGAFIDITYHTAQLLM